MTLGPIVVLNDAGASFGFADVKFVEPRPAKVSVTIRLDADIVDRFKASGKGWQTRINSALKYVRP